MYSWHLTSSPVFLFLASFTLPILPAPMVLPNSQVPVVASTVVRRLCCAGLSVAEGWRVVFSVIVIGPGALEANGPSDSRRPFVGREDDEVGGGTRTDWLRGKVCPRLLESFESIR